MYKPIYLFNVDLQEYPKAEVLMKQAGLPFRLGFRYQSFSIIGTPDAIALELLFREQDVWIYRQWNGDVECK